MRRFLVLNNFDHDRLVFKKGQLIDLMEIEEGFSESVAERLVAQGLLKEEVIEEPKEDVELSQPEEVEHKKAKKRGK